MIDNAEWLDQIKWIEFLRDYGKHFTINKMIAQETVQAPPRQRRAVHLPRIQLHAAAGLRLPGACPHAIDCRIQMGGSDQWGNIVNGIDLTRRIIDKQVFGVTTPLITTASGGKMGKTADGAVWLNPDMRSPYDYWQFWRNTEDAADVARFMRLFTDLPESEIASTQRRGQAARRSTTPRNASPMSQPPCCTARREAKKAAAAAEAVFKGGGTSSEGMPTFEVESAQAGYWLSDHGCAGRCRDLSTPRATPERQIAGNAVKLNGESGGPTRSTADHEAALDAGRHCPPLGWQEAPRAPQGGVSGILTKCRHRHSAPILNTRNGLEFSLFQLRTARKRSRLLPDIVGETTS